MKSGPENRKPIRDGYISFFLRSGSYEKLYQAVIQVFTYRIFSFAQALLAEKIGLLDRNMT